MDWQVWLSHLSRGSSARKHQKKCQHRSTWSECGNEDEYEEQEACPYLKMRPVQSFHVSRLLQWTFFSTVPPKLAIASVSISKLTFRFVAILTKSPCSCNGIDLWGITGTNWGGPRSGWAAVGFLDIWLCWRVHLNHMIELMKCSNARNRVWRLSKREKTLQKCLIFPIKHSTKCRSL